MIRRSGRDQPVSGVEWLIVAVLLLAALALRAPRISEGLPYFYHEDEGHHFNRIVDMVKSGDPNPRYFHKPTLHLYLRVPAVLAAIEYGVWTGRLTSVEEIRTRDPYGLADYAFTASHPFVVKATRCVSVVFSLLTILFIYLCCVELKIGTVARVGAAMLATFSPDLISGSAFIGVDVIMTGFCIAALYASLVAFRVRRAGVLYGAAWLAGCAVSTKYNAAPICLVPMVTALFAFQGGLRPALIAGAVSVISFLVASPFIIPEYQLFIKQLGYEIWHYGVAGHVGNEAEPGIAQAYFYWNWFTQSAIGYGATLLALATVIQVLVRRDPRGIITATFLVSFFALMVMQKVNFTRNMHVALPFMAVLAAYSGFARTQIRGVLVWGAVVELCVLLTHNPGAKPIAESRALVEDWLVNHAHEGVETALAGELQLAPRLYALRGHTRVSQEKTSLEALYLDGFDRVVLSGAEPRPAIGDVGAEVEFTASGVTVPQRLVANPQIEVVRLVATASTPVGETVEIRKGLNGEVLCSPGAQDNPEGHCWVTKRRAEVRLDRVSVTHPELEIMTPWDGQEVVLSNGSWSTRMVFSAADVGQWKEIKVPLAALEALRVSLTVVASPSRRGGGVDGRRLGIALRVRNKMKA